VYWSKLDRERLTDAALCSVMDNGLRKFCFLGVRCCVDCFSTIHNVTEYTMRQARERLHALMHPEEHLPRAGPANRRGRPPDASQAATTFIHAWLTRECMINARNGGLHLSFVLIRSLLYGEFVETRAAIAAASVACSESTFRGVLKQVLKTRNISMPRTASDLKSCGCCYRLSHERRSALCRGDHDAVALIETAMHEHQAVQYLLRDEQLARFRVAPLLRDSHLYLSIDATFPLQFPSMPVDTDEKRATPKAVQPFMALQDHGDAPTSGGELLFYLVGNGKDDANVCASYIDWWMQRRMAERQNRTLAEFHLDIDSGPGCKNTVIVGLLALYVARGVCQSVHVHFLLAGHSGNKLDGMTSHLRVGMRQRTHWSPATCRLKLTVRCSRCSH
jgi:hypothetical protein